VAASGVHEQPTWAPPVHTPRLFPGCSVPLHPANSQDTRLVQKPGVLADAMHGQPANCLLHVADGNESTVPAQPLSSQARGDPQLDVEEVVELIVDVAKVVGVGLDVAKVVEVGLDVAKVVGLDVAKVVGVGLDVAKVVVLEEEVVVAELEVVVVELEVVVVELEVAEHVA
jgi:hypothetical protein